MNTKYIRNILLIVFLWGCVETPPVLDIPEPPISEIITVTPIPETFTPIPPTDDTSLSSPTETLVPTATILPFPYALTIQNSVCFNGPSEFYQQAATVLGNILLYILGRSDESDWFLVQSSSVPRCWIKATNLTYQFDINMISVLHTAITKIDSTCRTGPHMLFKEQTYIPRGWRIFVNGKNSISAEWTLVTPHDSTNQCWVATNLLSTIDFFAIPTIETPTLPLVVVGPTSGGGGGNGGGNGGTSNGGGTPVPTPTFTLGPPPPTPTLCWPPGHCK